MMAVRSMMLWILFPMLLPVFRLKDPSVREQKPRLKTKRRKRKRKKRREISLINCSMLKPKLFF